MTKETTLVERLRRFAPGPSSIVWEAADALESSQAEIDRLTAALRFYGDERSYLAGGYGGNTVAAIFGDRGEMARAALNSKGTE